MSGPRGLCIMACVFCRDPDFQYWVHTQMGQCQTEAEAKNWLTATCGIGSRVQLDKVPEAAERFHRLVRYPYMAWKDQP